MKDTRIHEKARYSEPESCVAVDPSTSRRASVRHASGAPSPNFVSGASSAGRIHPRNGAPTPAPSSPISGARESSLAESNW